ncbi:hypothetical protein OAS86_03640 [Gammaproteobacteria bacterium]|nr:hypothetical protein [Gammaproteobacteria bacterium]
MKVATRSVSSVALIAATLISSTVSAQMLPTRPLLIDAPGNSNALAINIRGQRVFNVNADGNVFIRLEGVGDAGSNFVLQDRDTGALSTSGTLNDVSSRASSSDLSYVVQDENGSISRVSAQSLKSLSSQSSSARVFDDSDSDVFSLVSEGRQVTLSLLEEDLVGHATVSANYEIDASGCGFDDGTNWQANIIHALQTSSAGSVLESAESQLVFSSADKAHGRVRLSSVVNDRTDGSTSPTLRLISNADASVGFADGARKVCAATVTLSEPVVELAPVAQYNGSNLEASRTITAYSRIASSCGDFEIDRVFRNESGIYVQTETTYRDGLCLMAFFDVSDTVVIEAPEDLPIYFAGLMGFGDQLGYGQLPDDAWEIYSR